MKKIISFQRAVQMIYLLFGLFFIFHLLVITGIVFFDYVPIDFLWGGQMESKQQLLIFEFVSLVVLTLCFFVIWIKQKQQLKYFTKFTGVVNVFLWALLILFVLNTIGNIFAKTTFEKMMAIVTVLFAFFILRIALEKPANQ